MLLLCHNCNCFYNYLFCLSRLIVCFSRERCALIGVMCFPKPYCAKYYGLNTTHHLHDTKAHSFILRGMCVCGVLRACTSDVLSIVPLASIYIWLFFSLGCLYMGGGEGDQGGAGGVTSLHVHIMYM